MAIITVQRERVQNLWGEVMPLLERHWDEIAHFKDITLDPDVEAYNAAEAVGFYHVFTARADGELIGYVAYFVRPNMHYRNSVQAMEDVLFVLPEHRNATVGLRLLKFALDELAAQGVQAVMHHTKAAHSIAPLLERLGFELVDMIYVKRLY